MCTVTLSYNENDSVATQQLAALLNTGLFVQLNVQNKMDIDYSDPSLYEDNPTPLPYEKEYYTPEELRTMLVSDVNEIYGTKDVI